MLTAMSATGKLREMGQQAVANFREYLRIPSVHPNIDYEPCVKFLQSQAQGMGLQFKVHYCHLNNPIAIISWIGTNPALESILLNSHMDVVPVFEEHWSHKPFSADIDGNGNIYARGSQDMKCVGIQYLEAIRRLIEDKITLKRTLHVSFVPDEELGGYLGMRDFVHTQEFKDLNVGFALDEGMANSDEHFKIYYGERSVWHFVIHCPGQPGHGSLLLKNTAGEKIRYLMDKFSDFRAAEKHKLDTNPTLTIGDVTTVNVTMLKGGVQSNVIPDEFVMVVDCRVAVTLNHDALEDMVKQWCKEAGEGIWIEYDQKQPNVPPTELSDSNQYWGAFKKTFDDLGLKMKAEIFPAGTDCRYVRSLGIPALGFSPINNTPVLLHDHNEYLNVNVFLKVKFLSIIEELKDEAEFLKGIDVVEEENIDILGPKFQSRIPEA